MKKCLIVYDSYHHGNTKKVAEAMAEVSGAELCTTEEVPGKNLNEYELIGLGSGIAYGKHYEKLTEAAKALNLNGKSVFVFSTSGSGNKNYNNKLMEQLKEAGANITGSFICKGYDTMILKLFGGISKGHPNEQELSAAKDFILKLVR
ncbi:MAG TPA: flavodoxin family protein [Caproicibacter sp.]|nr:flavodoxin family protein [Caproicibacter sp.]